MNVFVLCTGRCGSMTFQRACAHLTNFTSSHESRVPLLGDSRLDYPENHIEIDNRLSWFLGRLDKKYGDSAYYVHLTRDPHVVAESWSRRFHILGGMATGYRDHILSGASTALEISRFAAAEDLVRTVNENIDLFLKDKTNVMRIRLEDVSSDFPIFWQWIGGVGDYSAAIAEFDKKHNSAQPRTKIADRIHAFLKRGVRAYFPPR